MLGRWFVSVSLAVLTGCAVVDTGQIDYRVAEPPGAITGRSPASPSCAAGIDTHCDPIQPARVVRRYLPSDNASVTPFETGDVFSVSIEQGVVGNQLLEGMIFGREFGRTGEFAILANVFEFAASADDQAKRRFVETGAVVTTPDDPSDVELKLVFFSDDVYKGQPYNISNIPLKSRTRYGGGSIGVQLVVLEVDAQSGPVAKLLTTLAKFGQQAIPGGGEIKDLLFDLGESMFTGGGKDDRIFDYRFVLEAAADDPHASRAAFVPGRYVLRRTYSRRDVQDWATLRLDHNTGRLLSSGDNGSWTEKRDEMYFTINIARYPQNTAPEFYAGEDFDAFRSRLTTIADARDAPLDAVTQRVESVLLDRRSGKWGAELSSAWTRAEAHLRHHHRFNVGSLEADAFAGCRDAARQVERRRDLAKRQAQDAIRSFRATYQQALGDRYDPAGDEKERAVFATADRAALISMVARFFMPWRDAAIEAKFTDADAFEKAYIAADAGPALEGDAVEPAPATAAVQGCEELIERGLAGPRLAGTR